MKLVMRNIQYQNQHVKFIPALMGYSARCLGFPDQFGLTQNDSLRKIMDLIDIRRAEAQKITRLTAAIDSVKIAALQQS